MIMRLAFLTSLVPTGRPDTGFEIANESILDGLADIGADVTVFGYRRIDDIPDPSRTIITLGVITIETASASASTRLGWIRDSARLGLPLSSAKLRVVSETTLIRLIEENGPFDGVIVNTAQMAGAFPGIAKRWPSMLVAHNIEHLSARQNAQHTRGIKGLIYQREARLLERMEQKVISAAHHVGFLSEEDRAVLGQFASSSNVLALLTPEPAASPSPEKAFDIGLIGTWTWTPNLIGLRWFFDHVVPLLPENLTIGLAGRLPDNFGSVPSRVNHLGRVADATAFVRSCAVMALTSRIGTGVQLKTIEIMRLGWPAVATSSSLRGTNYRPVNLAVADEPEPFVKHLVQMLDKIRQKTIAPVDPMQFLHAQRASMHLALEQGLASLKK
jgi:hypothetical protein